MSDLRIPADFEMVEQIAGTVTVKHRASGRYASVHACQRPDQSALDYLISRKRIEYRRDRLFLAVGRDIDRFRACQAEMRKRGYRI